MVYLQYIMITHLEATGRAIKLLGNSESRPRVLHSFKHSVHPRVLGDPEVWSSNHDLIFEYIGYCLSNHVIQWCIWAQAEWIALVGSRGHNSTTCLKAILVPREGPACLTFCRFMGSSEPMLMDEGLLSFQQELVLYTMITRQAINRINVFQIWINDKHKKDQIWTRSSSQHVGEKHFPRKHVKLTIYF